MITKVSKGVQSFYDRMIKPRSVGVDARRHEFILNIFLLGAITLSFVAVVNNQYNIVTEGTEYDGVPIHVTALIFLFFLALYLLSRSGFHTLSSYVLITIYFAMATFTLYQWGVDVPIALLIYALVIVISGILISTKFSFFVASLAALVLATLQYLQNALIITPELYWKEQSSTALDTILVISVLAVIVTVSWLSNREIERSLKRARASEADLKKERDELEVTVARRTEELRQVHRQQLESVNNLVQLGRLTSGVLHDIANPLMTVSTTLETIGLQGEDIADIEEPLKRAQTGARQIDLLLKASRQQIQGQNKEKLFSVSEVIHKVVILRNYRAQEQQVKINFVEPAETIELWGNPTKFHQVMGNLIDNAIDAYQGQKTDKRIVEIGLTIKPKTVEITVQDWGVGIDPKHLRNIFDYSFTTKSEDEGTGIGLSTSNSIIKDDFAGTIKVSSQPSKGSIFTIEMRRRRKK